MYDAIGDYNFSNVGIRWTAGLTHILPIAVSLSKLAALGRLTV